MTIIKPTKYTNIDQSLLGLSAEILKLLQEEPSQKYNQILWAVVRKKGKNAKENFLLSLSFLYLVGKIKYFDKEDVIQLLQN